jgi:hypothetical protein
VLWRAWVAVRRNNGAPGIDKITLAAVGEYGVTRLLGELREGRYRPLPARQVLVPKPRTTKQRPLPVPPVRDRIVKAAVKIVLEPVFEADFLPCSFGFPPGRSRAVARRRFPERRLHLVDIENLAGGPLPSLGQVRDAQGRYADCGANLAPLDVLRHENVAGRFTHVAIGSGNHPFAEEAARLAAQGVWVTVVSRQRNLSPQLALAACEVIFLDPEAKAA